MKKLFILFIAVAGFGVSSFAQATSGAATSTATIINPISIEKVTDMNFGNVAVSATIGAGTVILTPGGLRTPTGGVTLPIVTGTVAAASFTVGGEGGYTYSISLPLEITLSKVGGGSMTLDELKSSPDAAGSGTLSGSSPGTGTETLTVGGTLHVAPYQAVGVYTNTTDLKVTVNYD